MDDNNWDLYAVVRGCSASTPAAASDPFFSSFPPLLKEEDVDGDKDRHFVCPELMGTSSYLCELQELCKPFYAMEPLQEPLPQQLLPPLLSPVVAYTRPPQQQSRHEQRTASQAPRSKRRKNQQKKVVCQVPADGVHSDLWAWRKYGQKPIKGSPYPRGYYKCSSSKGCQARKQVERSRADPGMLLITYTAEHNHSIPTHRNSLAGSTRQKLPPLVSTNQPSAAADGGDHPSSSPLSSPTAAAGLSPKTPLADSMEDDELLVRRRSRKGEGEEEEGQEDEEELLSAGNVEPLEEDDALFLGMDTMTLSSGYFDEGGSSDDDYFFRSPWLTSFNAAAAAGGR